MIIKSPSGLWGLSMGGAYAAHAAAKSPGLWQTIVIVSSFDSLVGVIEDKLADYPIPFPKAAKLILLGYIRLLGNINYNEVMSAYWSQTITIPALIVHGDQDKLIVFSRGKNLFASFKNSPQKQWLAINGAGHNDILVTKAPLYAAMSRWFLNYCKTVENK
ncbi:MAG: alpha/beta hydrolase [Methylococcaceae bacterium]|nr:alpha/beta hydrolase [Methylococcaceae bacterium]